MAVGLVYRPFPKDEAVPVVRCWVSRADLDLYFAAEYQNQIVAIAGLTKYQNYVELDTIKKAIGAPEFQFSSFVAYCCKQLKRYNLIVTFCHKRGTMFQGSSWNYSGKTEHFQNHQFSQLHHVYWKSLNTKGKYIAGELNLKNLAYPDA